MFNNSRYMTRGIQEEVGLDLQLLLWQLIDDCKGKGNTLDYIQIFELSTESVREHTVQVVLHRQEEPYYQSIHRLTAIVRPLNQTKVWVMDDGDHSTMLFPNEY